MGLDIHEIRTMGGGSKSDIWNQIKADITGKTLQVTNSSQDTACLGAAILAGSAVGIFSSVENAVGSMIKIRKTYEPNTEVEDLYNRQYKKFRLLYKSLEELYDIDATE